MSDLAAIQTDAAPALKPAMEVWEEAWRAWDDIEPDPNYLAKGDDAAAAVIEADRQAIIAAKDAQIAALQAHADALAGALEAMYGATPLHDEGCDGGLLGCACDLRAANQKAEPALRAYEEFRR